MLKIEIEVKVRHRREADGTDHKRDLSVLLQIKRLIAFTFCDAPLRRPLSHKALFPVGSSSTSSLVLGGSRTWKMTIKAKNKASLVKPDAIWVVHHVFLIYHFIFSHKLNALTHNTYNADVAKLVCRGHGVIVQQTGCGHPARICVISKDDELVFVTSVTDPKQAFLNVRHDHSLANGMDASHQVWNVLNKEKA